MFHTPAHLDVAHPAGQIVNPIGYTIPEHMMADAPTAFEAAQSRVNAAQSLVNAAERELDAAWGALHAAYDALRSA